MLNDRSRGYLQNCAIQNNVQWPCSMCPIPQFRPVGVRTSHIFKIFPGQPEFWAPLQIPIWDPPGCTLLHCHAKIRL